jgi:Outer membrane protein beta-barrel domain
MLNNFPNFIFMILIFVANVIGQAENSNHKKLNNHDKQESKIFLSFGTNLSSYLHEEDNWHLGYNIGLTFNITVYRRLSVSIPFSYSRLNATPKEVEGRYYSIINSNIYKKLTNWKVSFAYFEIPILLNYKLFVINKYKLSFMFGPGLAIKVKDFSNIEKTEITEEIIGNQSNESIPQEPQNLLHSAFNINSGVRIHFRRIYIEIGYILYPSEIKRINKLNVISLRLGIAIL